MSRKALRFSYIKIFNRWIVPLVVPWISSSPFLYGHTTIQYPSLITQMDAWNHAVLYGPLCQLHAEHL